MAVLAIVGAVASLGGAVLNFFSKKREMDMVENMINERRAQTERILKQYNDSYNVKLQGFMVEHQENMRKDAKNLYFQKKASVLFSLVKRIFFANILYFIILFILLWLILKKMNRETI